MVHGVEIKDGKGQMFSGEGLTPWHGLGNVIEGLATAEEALKLAGLDWEVQMIQATKQWNGQTVNIPDRFSTTRMTDGKDLGIVSKGYHVYQNAEAFSFLNAITDTGSGEAVFSTAGSLFGGSRVFITLKIGDGFTVGDNDAHDLYLMVTNSHDGNQSFTATVTPIRAVCNNTVTLALREAKTKWTLRHKVSLEGKVHEAREALEMAFRYEDAFAAEVDKMIDIQIQKDQFFKIVDKIVPVSKRQHDKDVEEIMEIWANEPTCQMGGGEDENGWRAFNAITYFTDHKEYRTPESKFNSIIGSGIGTGLAEKLRPAAHKAILSFA